MDCTNSKIFYANCFWVTSLKTYFINLQSNKKTPGLHVQKMVHIHLVTQKNWSFSENPTEILKFLQQIQNFPLF